MKAQAAEPIIPGSVPFTVYEVATGRIVKHGECSPADYSRQITEPGLDILGLDLDDLTHWVSDGQPAYRPKVDYSAPAELGGVVFAMYDVPAGTVIDVIWTAVETFTVDDGEFEYSTDFPGLYTFQITPPFPYQTETVGVHVK